MGNAAKGYWIFLLLALAAVIAALVMRSSPSEHTRDIGKVIGYSAIVFLLIARFGFRKRRPPEPPMPPD